MQSKYLNKMNLRDILIAPRTVIMITNTICKVQLCYLPSSPVSRRWMCRSFRKTTALRTLRWFRFSSMFCSSWCSWNFIGSVSCCVRLKQNMHKASEGLYLPHFLRNKLSDSRIKMQSEHNCHTPLLRVKLCHELHVHLLPHA